MLHYSNMGNLPVLSYNRMKRVDGGSQSFYPKNIDEIMLVCEMMIEGVNMDKNFFWSFAACYINYKEKIILCCSLFQFVAELYKHVDASEDISFASISAFSNKGILRWGFPSSPAMRSFSLLLLDLF